MSYTEVITNKVKWHLHTLLKGNLDLVKQNLKNDWALQGLERLQKEKSFSYSKTTSQVKNNWIRKSDSFAAFLMDNIEEDYDRIITKDELRKNYSQYCREHKLVMTGDRHIKSLLVKFGAWEDRDQTTGKGYIWKGIKFSNNYLNQDNYGFLPNTENPNSSIGQNTLVKVVNIVTEEEVIDEKPKKKLNIKEKIKSCFLEKIDVLPINTDEIISYVQSDGYTKPDKIEAALKELKTTGEVYEPKPGIWRIT